MISYIRGTLVETLQDTLVLENHGIGYNIRVPATVFSQLPKTGEETSIYTYLYVREDAINLFGFLTRDDLNVFQLLLNVSGIGPKGALAILSTMTADDLRFAVLSDDAKTIAKAPGVGAKTAKRLIIELKDKFKLEEAFEHVLVKSAAKAAPVDAMLAKNEAVEALVALGYSNAEALKAVSAVADVEEKDSEQILKEALKKLI